MHYKVFPDKPLLGRTYAAKSKFTSEGPFHWLKNSR